ncbi:MAG: sigma-54-dependent transcriptional regulator [Phycisphaerae bacterium]
MHAEPSVATPRILILDDDRILAESLGQFLRREGYEVELTDEAAAAMKRLADGGFELLLVDVNVPTLKPAAWLKQLRQVAPHVVTVVLSGYGSVEQAVEATRAGAFEYLTKPVVDDEIRVVVEKAARHQMLLFENRRLREQLETRFGLANVVGRDARMLKVYELIEAVAEGRTTVLLTGESGTGKSLAARAIHQRSSRRDGPFVEISCGALPESLLESELFGHVKGGFTGAATDKPGRFLSADGGTIFLDEINSASPAMQVKLLRVLQERTFEPVGSSTPRTVDVRVVLATNGDLAAMVRAGEFRQDLYWRINVVTIPLPTLRDRPGDVPLLAEHFLRRFASEAGRQIVGFTPEAVQALQRYTWPGNVRELENVVERSVVLCRKLRIEAEDLPPSVLTPARGEVAPMPSYLGAAMTLEKALEEPERQIILAALKRNDWARQETADELGINRTTLYKKMRKFKLDVPEGVDVASGSTLAS